MHLQKKAATLSAFKSTLEHWLQLLKRAVSGGYPPVWLLPSSPRRWACPQNFEVRRDFVAFRLRRVPFVLVLSQRPLVSLKTRFDVAQEREI